jgi:hypothetical protein
MNTHLEYYSRIQRMTQIAALHTLQCDAVRLAAMQPAAGERRRFALCGAAAAGLGGDLR